MFRLLRSAGPRAAITWLAVPLLLVAACHSTHVTPPKRFDGSTLYRGLVLGYGPAALAVPEIRDNLRIDLFVKDRAQLNRLTTAYDRIVGEIQIVDRGFFDRFSRAMTSGDQVAVQRGLWEAGEVTVQAARRLPEFKEGVEALRKNPQPLVDAVARYNADVRPADRFERAQIDQMIDVLSSDRPVELAFGFTFAAAIVAVAWIVAAVDLAVVTSLAVAIAVELWIGVDQYGPSAFAANQGSVFREQLVNSIAVNLYAAQARPYTGG